MNIFLIAARNVLRNRGRTLLTVLGSAIAILAFVMLRTVLSSWMIAAEYAINPRVRFTHSFCD